MFADSGTRGLCNYVWQAIKLWHSFSPEQYKILVDGEEIDCKSVLVTVGNSNQWGNGAKVTPLASVSDGILEVTVLDMFQREILGTCFGRA